MQAKRFLIAVQDSLTFVDQIILIGRKFDFCQTLRICNQRSTKNARSSDRFSNIKYVPEVFH